jgi:hypothetical protein
VTTLGLVLGLCGTACGGDSAPSDATAAATTVVPLAKAEYTERAAAICQQGAAKAAAAQPTPGMTPEQTAAALRQLAAVTRETLNGLRTLPPPEPSRPYVSWLDTVDKTVTAVDQGAAALAAGDAALAQDRFREAGALTETAQGAARLLGLDACLFDGTGTAAPTTTVVGPPAPTEAPVTTPAPDPLAPPAPAPAPVPPEPAPTAPPPSEAPAAP